MGAKLGSNDGPMAEMNVTPLIDVVLVLLVVFMVITPMLQTGLEVELPTVAKHEDAEEEGGVVNTVNAESFITISVTKDGRWGVQQDLATKDDLIDLINAELAKDGARYSAHIAAGKPPEDAPQPRSILIKADHMIEYGKVREVMDLISDGGWGNIRLAVNEQE